MDRPRKNQKSKKRIRRGAEPWTDNTEQAFMFYFETPENPGWLIGAG